MGNYENLERVLQNSLSANKIVDKAQTNLWGYPEDGGLLNFEDE